MTIWRVTVVVQAVLLALAGTVATVLAVVGTGYACVSAIPGAAGSCGHTGQGLPWAILAPSLFAIAGVEVVAALQPQGRLRFPIRLMQVPIALAIVVAETVWATTRFHRAAALLGLGALFIVTVVAAGPPRSASKNSPVM